jgi:hypothetical protein
LVRITLFFLVPTTQKNFAQSPNSPFPKHYHDSLDVPEFQLLTPNNQKNQVLTLFLYFI